MQTIKEIAEIEHISVFIDVLCDYEDPNNKQKEYYIRIGKVDTPIKISRKMHTLLLAERDRRLSIAYREMREKNAIRFSNTMRYFKI
jgi:hypothetical protein